MPFQINNPGPSVSNNPITHSLFVDTYPEIGFPTPPGTYYRITDAFERRITDGTFDNRVTDP